MEFYNSIIKKLIIKNGEIMVTILLCVLASLGVMMLQDKTDTTGLASILQFVVINVSLVLSWWIPLGLVVADLSLNKGKVAKLAASYFE